MYVNAFLESTIWFPFTEFSWWDWKNSLLACVFGGWSMYFWLTNNNIGTTKFRCFSFKLTNLLLSFLFLLFSTLPICCSLEALGSIFFFTDLAATHTCPFAAFFFLSSFLVSSFLAAALAFCLPKMFIMKQPLVKYFKSYETENNFIYSYVMLPVSQRMT